MKLIGICGGIASGKSFVTRMFRELGAEVLDADKMGHAVLEEPEVRSALIARWGEGIVTPEGPLNRKEIAQRVFAATQAAKSDLQLLERLTHPRIRQRLEGRIAELANLGQHPAVILDAPLMFKAGWDKLCDIILFVDTPASIRLERARQRGWDEADFATREAAQESLEFKRGRADSVIDNSGSAEHTQAQVREFWSRYIATP